MDEDAVSYAVEMIDSFYDTALKYDREGAKNHDLVTVLLTVAHESSAEVFGFDVYTAQLEKSIPKDWRFRWGKSYQPPI